MHEVLEYTDSGIATGANQVFSDGHGDWSSYGEIQRLEAQWDDGTKAFYWAEE